MLFENYLLPDHFANMPDGMIPSCYPADHYDGGFIPNWGLWFLVQLEQYLLRSGDHELVGGTPPAGAQAARLLQAVPE